ncbi:DUF4352 domain-containing protein [Gracilibacillus thailandensis]|uniref:DUF4352 domain-containing protein n=1 Tax=Gracilibacillus thailandensis TaxID=563735 RepID=A0A6N7R0F1_9BACI|nr:DUF4352 domain-containing protein [Gracilibacillus thailandensis]MRI66635.1 DUF4352 domain-containing protein [Gracilibacillus thailandensis]
MKKYLFVLIAVSMLLIACEETGTTTSESANGNEESDVKTEEDKSTKEENTKGVVAEEDFDKMYSDPSSYQDYEVEYTAQVFTKPERDADGTYLQAYADPINYEQNTIIFIADPDLAVESEDYITVKGIVRDQFDGENLVGGSIAAPMIEANSVEVVDYITAVSPTIETVEVGQEIDQQGYLVTLQKIELAENQTRVYVKVSNNTNDSISYFAHSTKLIVDNQQLEPEFNYESGLPEVQSDILADVESEGVITFPAIDQETTSLKFHSEGYSDNWELEIEPFVFDVEI